MITSDWRPTRSPAAMSDHQPSSTPQRGKKKGRDNDKKFPGYRPGGTRGEVYLHTVTDDEAASLTSTGDESPLKKIKETSGADIEFDPASSSIQDRKILIIRGTRIQIVEAAKLINERTGNQKPIAENAQEFWLRWVQDAFPNLDSSSYFVPPVHLNHVPMTSKAIGCRNVQVLGAQSGQTSNSQASDARHDAARQQVLFCLQKMANQNGEILFGISQLKFGQYLREPCYAAAAAHLPLSANLPPKLPPNWKQGDFDILLIHQLYGFVVCKVKSWGGNVKELSMSQQDLDKNMKKKLKEAASYLNKAKAMLSHLVSDIAPDLRITKAIVVPNITSRQIQTAVDGDPNLRQELCACLEITQSTEIPGLCLCSDQLSDARTPWDVSSDVLREFESWWKRLVAGCGPDSQMTPVLYRKLVASGPATTVTVPCVSAPRLCVKTLSQAVSWTGECYAAHLTLFPEQVDLLESDLLNVFLTGPPGTGKTVVLQLKGAQWLESGNDVHIVSTWAFSRAPSHMLHHVIQSDINTEQSTTRVSKLHFLEYDLDGGKEVEKAVNELSQMAKEGSLYVIADEAGPYRSEYFNTFCEKLRMSVDDLHLWAANCYSLFPPRDWQVVELTRPLRSPPAVVREVERDTEIARHHDVLPYSRSHFPAFPAFTDGPLVKRLYHKDHSKKHISDCVTCGQNIASFLLKSLRVTAKTANVNISQGETATIPPLCFKDVLVLYWKPVTEDSGIVAGLRENNIPVRVMTDDDIEDLAKARSDVVWVANGYCVRGLERKVIVCLDVLDVYVPLRSMSRCSSQLVIISDSEQQN